MRQCVCILLLDWDFFELVYEACLEHELKKRGLIVQRQVPISVVYDSMRLGNPVWQT